MFRATLSLWLFLAASALSWAQGDASAPAPAAPEGVKVEPPKPDAAPAAVATEATPAKKVSVLVIPVRTQIGDPILYILRRGLKDADAAKFDVVLLDMKTPGGRLGNMLDIMEALDKFAGRTITYVNDEATSAGALIAAVTDDIYFSPRGTMGSAEPVTGQGADINESMKRKVTSYMAGKVDAYVDTNPRRADVIKAMLDPDFELKIGDEVLKPKGALLNLSAKKALAPYGEPPTPLLAAGIANDIDALLTAKYGAGNFAVTRLEVTWSEKLADVLTSVSSILLGLGILALVIEFKTPGFGFFGVAGIVLVGVVFLSNYVAGLSGHEPMLVFGLGLLLVVLELFFFPGVLVAALTGVVLMLGSLVWSMADIWPNEPIAWSGDLFVGPLVNVLLGVALAIALGAALLRFLPSGWFWGRMVLNAAVDSQAQQAGSAPTAATGGMDALVGRRGIAATALLPSGQIEIDGERFEARVAVGSVERGATIVVTGRSGFSLLVEEVRA